jgi:hypothetical protein
MVTQPCDLKGICKLINPVEFADDWGSGGIRFVDSKGSELVFSYFNGKVYFKTGEQTKIESQPGSSGEQCLLKILKESFAAVYDPAFDKDPGAESSKRYWEQRTVKHFIRVLERRCATKKQS